MLRGQLAHHPEHRSAVGLLGEQRGELHEALPDVRALVDQQPFEVRDRGIEQAAVDEQRDHGLTRLYGIGIDRHPGAGGLDSLLERAGTQRHLGRALGDTRIAGRLREVVEGGGRDVEPSPLGCDLGQQVLEHHLPAELQPRQPRIDHRAAAPATGRARRRRRLRQQAAGRSGRNLHHPGTGERLGRHLTSGSEPGCKAGPEHEDGCPERARRQMCEPGGSG